MLRGANALSPDPSGNNHQERHVEDEAPSGGGSSCSVKL